MKADHVEQVRHAAEESFARIRDHEFIAHATFGKLEEGQCIRWVMCAGRESRSFPDILQNMLEIVDSEEISKILGENLADEFGNGNPEQAHFRHYVHLLAKLGFSEAEFNAYPEKAGIQLALHLAYNISMQEDVPLALGYMLVNEGMTPITYGAVDVALHVHFPSLTTEFFRLHVEVDEEHVAQLYEAVSTLPDEALPSVLFGIAVGERGMAVLLDEALGLFEHWIPSNLLVVVS